MSKGIVALLSYRQLADKCKEDELGWCTDQNQRHEATEAVIDTCHTLLPLLTKKLNSIHGTSYSQRYWHILLGAWLYHFCCIVYDRKSLLTYHDGGDIPKIESRLIPRDTYESIKLAETADFNTQLFRDILLGIKQIDKSLFFDKKLNNIGKINFIYIKNFVFNSLSSLFFGSKSIAVSFTAMPLELQLKIFGYFRKIRPIKVFNDNHELFDSTIDIDIRKKLQLEQIDNQFFNLVGDLLPYYLPVCFVEGFKKLGRLSERYRSCPIAILSTVEIYYRHESFKYWMGKCSEQGTKILNLQHGGNYGVSWRSGESFIERESSDIFYSWGWKHNAYRNDESRIKPMPVLPHFFGNQRDTGFHNDSQRILFASDLMREVLREFGGISNDAHNRDQYLFNQLTFYEHLNQEVRQSFYVRVAELKKSSDMQLYVEAWKNKFPSILFDDRNIDFRTSLRNSKLFIVDHISTTWIESLVIGVPTIILIDKGNYDFSVEFEEIFEMLHSVSLVHFSIESAAKMVNAINHDVISWWEEKQRSDTIKKVLNRIAIKSEDVIRDWSEELKKISNQ